MIVKEFLDNFNTLVKDVLTDYRDWMIRSIKVDVKARKVYIHLIRISERKDSLEFLSVHDVLRDDKYLTFNLNLWVE